MKRSSDAIDISRGILVGFSRGIVNNQLVDERSDEDCHNFTCVAICIAFIHLPLRLYETEKKNDHGRRVTSSNSGHLQKLLVIKIKAKLKVKDKLLKELLTLNAQDQESAEKK